MLFNPLKRIKRTLDTWNKNIRDPKQRLTFIVAGICIIIMIIQLILTLTQKNDFTLSSQAMKILYL